MVEAFDELCRGGGDGTITAEPASYQSSYWKLNKSIFNEKHFQVNFKDVLNDVVSFKPNYKSVSVWFDKVFKPSVRAFLMDFSRERSKSRRDTVSFFSVALQEAIKVNDWKTVSYVRSKLKNMHKEDSVGLIVRSRYSENLEGERKGLLCFI